MRNTRKKNHIIKKIDFTRNQLHKAIDNGNDKEILRLSCKLDSLIVKYLVEMDCCLKNKDNSTLQPPLNVCDLQRKVIFKAKEFRV